MTSDIHGPLAYFEKLLEKADFSDEDILIMVGDLIEKRPESLKKPAVCNGTVQKRERHTAGRQRGRLAPSIKGICEESVRGFWRSA
ncbi:MAG TPA: metallophosphoesterase [Firmicutes bacterium]|nr:metallophosphoesterase [Bacillota bacterium]